MYTINNLTANEREKYKEHKENQKRERAKKQLIKITLIKSHKQIDRNDYT
jgi:hypothetical protein